MTPLPTSEWAFSGAGTLGSIEVGAASALWPHTRPSDVVGTSAGSIVGGLISLGADPQALQDVVVSADFAKLIPIRVWLAPFRGYLASNKSVTAWLKDITHNAKLGDCLIPFRTITSDLTTSTVQVWDSQRNPEMPLWKAILGSMSIPLVYPAVDERYQDGGMCDNLGINFLSGKRPGIGLRTTYTTVNSPARGFIAQAMRDLSIMLSASEQDMVLLAKATGIPVVGLDAGDACFLDTNMTRWQKNNLYNCGATAVVAWMNSVAGKEWLEKLA